MKPSRKRKSEGSSKQAAKKARKEKQVDGGAEDERERRSTKKLAVRKASKSSAKAVKTPRKKGDDVPSSQVRKSVRRSNATNYAEQDSSEDDEEMEKWQSDAEEEAGESSTPPTSDPTPAPMTMSELPVEPEKGTNGHRSAKAVAANISKPRAPQRNTRTVSKEKDVMDLPSDDDVEMPDPPKSKAKPERKLPQRN
ncbi:hypothetical protein LTR53_018724, partial [Teratosphaeriaceae sp. CCFEE 6253]